MNTRMLDRPDDALRSLLDRKTNLAVKALLWLLACAVFYLFAVNARYAKIEEFYGGDITSRVQFTAAVYTVIFGISLAVQLRIGRNLPLYGQILTAVITGLVLLAKISLLDYESDDYQIFLTNWIYDYSNMGIKEGLGRYLQSDYTPPYLYLLQIVSRMRNYPWNYLVKAWSVLFEVLLCYSLTKLASLKVKGEASLLLFWHLASMLPTVVFNGAYWGQCDVIYTSFCVLALYLGMRKHSVRSMICFGVALSFKLQSVFFFPVMLPLWLRKDLKLRWVILVPTAYMVMMIPALWGGKSLHHVLTCYIQQSHNYNFIAMNGTSIWNLFDDEAMNNSGLLYKWFGNMAMMMGFAAMAGMCLMVTLHKDRLSDESVVLACLLTCCAVPYFLPKMHERYTFGSDVLSMAAAAHNPKLAVLPLLFGLSSYLCYTGGLPGPMILPLKYASILQGTAVLLTAAALWHSLNKKDESCAMEVKG